MLYIRSLFVVRIAVGVGGAGMAYKISASVRREDRLVLEEQSELSLERGDEVEVDVDEAVDFVDWADEDEGSGLDIRNRSGEEEPEDLAVYIGSDRVRDGEDEPGLGSEYNDRIDGV